MAFRIHRGTAVKQLMADYDFTEERAKRVLDIANQFGRKAEPCPGGFVHVVYDGWSEEWPYTERFRIYDHTGKGERETSPKNRPEKVAPGRAVDYTPLITTILNRKRNAMPPKGRRAAAAPVEPEEQEEAEQEGQFDRHLTKDLSATMQDYAEWFDNEVTDIAALGKTDPDRLLALGSTLYPHFQKSDLNQTRREARRSERAAEEPEEEEAPPAKSAARGRAAKGASAPAPAPAPAPARGRAAAAPARPAGRRGAAATAAPY
jgi:hypothetical protein